MLLWKRPQCWTKIIILFLTVLVHASIGAEAVLIPKQEASLDQKAIERAIQKKAAAAMAEQRQDIEAGEKKKTLEGELRYSKAKLAAAQKKVALQTAVNNTEEVEKAQIEVRDWETRIKDTEAQINEMEAQLAPPAPDAGGTDDVILPGENLDLYVVEDSTFNGHYQVRRGGYVIIPQVGRVLVAGKKLAEAEAVIRKALESSQLQHATVMVEKLSGSDVTSGPVIFLGGELKNPRAFRIPPHTAQTLVSVILSSGGITDRGDLTRVRVMRVAANNGVVEEVNVQRILDGSGLGSDLALSDGDVVMVPAGSEHVVFLTGNVKRQGSQAMKPGDHLSVYNAILNAGGFSRFADTKKVYVLRSTEDGSKARIPVNIKEIQNGGQPDIPLQVNDVVVVPEKFFSF